MLLKYRSGKYRKLFLSHGATHTQSKGSVERSVSRGLPVSTARRPDGGNVLGMDPTILEVSSNGCRLAALKGTRCG